MDVKHHLTSFGWKSTKYSKEYQAPEEHNENLKKVLLRARERGIKFNAQKCSIGVTSVPFFGQLITDTGLKADPKKLEASTQLQKPDCRKKVETLLGLIDYRI